MEQIKLLKTILRIFRVVLIVIAACVVIFLIYQDFVPSGTLIAENTIEKRSAIFSGFYPEMRIQKMECNKIDGCWQTMVCDPVYFNISIPRSFDRARVIIKYKKSPGQKKFQIGLDQRNGKWNFQLVPFAVLGNDNGWEIAEAKFSVLPKYSSNNRQLKFMLSAPEMDLKRQEIKIHGIQVILEREPITWQNIFPRLRNYFIRLLNRES